MLDRAGNADRDVERRAHGLPGLPDLIGVGAPARIHDRTRGTDRGSTPERARELFQHLEVGGLLEPAAARDDDLRFRDVERARRRGLDLAHRNATGQHVHSDRFGRACLGSLHRREHVGTQRHYGRLGPHLHLE